MNKVALLKMASQCAQRNRVRKVDAAVMMRWAFDEIGRLERERNSYLAHAAFLLSESTISPTRDGWPPSSAIARIREDAATEIDSLQGWSECDLAYLKGYRNAVNE